jgi:hypothetical protein
MANKMRTFRDLFAKLPADGKTRHLLRSFNLGMMGGAALPSVQKLAVELGFDVYLLDLPRNVRGRLEADTFAENGYRIEVNKRDDVQTRRWTVLHEIMHFFLHRRDDPFAIGLHRAGGGHFYDAQERQEEREANEFTEALVFGESALSAAASLHGKDLVRLAKHFGVSIETVRIALSRL